MGLIEYFKDRVEIRNAKKRAMKITRDECRRYDAKIDAARDAGDVIGVLVNGGFKSVVRENGKAIAKSKNPMECDIRRTGTNLIGASSRCTNQKLKEWRKK